MEDKTVTAKLNNIRMSAQKLRLVVNAVKEMKPVEAVDHLEFMPHKGAEFVKKTLVSAMANAKDRFGAKKAELSIAEMYVGEAPTYKRGRPMSRGRYYKIMKRGSNLTIKLAVN